MQHPIPKTMILITILFMDLLVGMEFDLFAPSFPEIQSQFSLTPSWVEALLTANFLGYGIGLFCVGALADRFGRKPILLLGILIFTIGSLLCLWSPFYAVLITGRLLQGFGISSPALLSFLIIADSYPIRQQQFYIAMLNGFKNASVAAAPVFGSYITLYFHWQGNFKTLILLGLIALLMTILFIPSYQLPEQKEPMSLRGYLPLFQSKPMLLLIMHLIFLFVPYWIFVGISPLLYMEDLGVNLKQFGFYQGSLALAFALGSVLYGLVIHKFEHKKMLLLSNFLFAASTLLTLFLAFSDFTPAIVITFALLLFVIGQIVPSTIIYPLCLNYMPQMKGRVSGLLGAGTLILQSFGLQLAGYYYNGTFHHVGLIIVLFIVLIMVTLFYITRNKQIMSQASD